MQADDKIDQAFGEEGRISLTQLIQQHNNSVDSLTRKYRLDLEQQQQIYLDQIRGCRDEIQRLEGAAAPRAEPQPAPAAAAAR